MHTVEKIGGTSMSRFEEVLDNIFIGRREGAALYQRIFVVSAYSGMTNLLLEHKKTGEPGVYALFASIGFSMSQDALGLAPPIAHAGPDDEAPSLGIDAAALCPPALPTSTRPFLLPLWIKAKS